MPYELFALFSTAETPVLAIKTQKHYYLHCMTF